MWDLDKSKWPFARNEVFARKGFIFKNSLYRNYFSHKSWYEPKISRIDDISLNPVELFNVKLIDHMEGNNKQECLDKWRAWLTEEFGEIEINKDFVVKRISLKSILHLSAQRRSLTTGIDLTGDGVNEELVITSTSLYPGTYELKIGQTSREVQEYGLGAELIVVDIDQNDDFREIAILFVGPSDGSTTLFFRYYEDKIYYLGKLNGSPNFDTHIYRQNGRNILATIDGRLIANPLDPLGIGMFNVIKFIEFKPKRSKDGMQVLRPINKRYDPQYWRLFVMKPITVRQIPDHTETTLEGETIILLGIYESDVLIEDMHGRRYQLNKPPNPSDWIAPLGKGWNNEPILGFYINFP